MTHRERLDMTLNHKQPDRVVLDFGATGQTGINASTLYKLRKALGLEEKPIKVIEPFQMLGEIEDDLLDMLDVDTIGLYNYSNMLGYANDNWKPWTMPDGTPVLMGGGFEYDYDAKGNCNAYPQGNRNAPYSARMPKTGSFFDGIERSEPFDEDNLCAVDDFKDDFPLATDEDARYWEKEAKRLYEETDRAIVGVLGGAGLGDVATIPGPALIMPTGIRSVADWLMAHAMCPDYIEEVFAMQTEVMLKNMELYFQAVGNKVQVLWTSGTDFGTQNATFTSLDTFRKLYKPFYTKINGWVHTNTKWKTFYHTCGAIMPLLDDLAEMGVDCLNPVQLSAKGMDGKVIKEKYGDKFVFWGGGVDTQRVLPFGTPDEVRAQVQERLDLFAPNGGFVFNTIHNIVSNVPPENIIAMFETVLGKKLV